jgi:arsenate reductase
MKKIWQLSTCNTCQRLLGEIQHLADYEVQDIKEKNISAEELDALSAKTGSYESLFSRRAMKFRAWGLHEKNLTEQDYRELILKEYTFLKRPVIFDGEKVFAGSLKKPLNG